MINRTHAGPDGTGVSRSSGNVRSILPAVLLVLCGLLVFATSRERAPFPALAASPIAVPTGVCALPGGSSTPVPAPPSETPGIPVAAEGDVPTQITTAVATLAACWRDAAWETSLALVTDRYLRADLNTTDRVIAATTLVRLSAAGLVGVVALDTIGDIRTQGIGFASAEVTWHQGKALRHDRWRFVAAQGRWLLDKIEPLDPPSTGGEVGIEATIDVDRLLLSRNRVVDPGIVVIHIRNLRAVATSLGVYRATTTAQLRERLSGATPPAGDSPFVGELIVPANEEADLILADLASDTYTIVAGLRGPNGEIHIDDAYSATLSIADA